MASFTRRFLASGTGTLALACAGIPREPETPCQFAAAKTTLESVGVSVADLHFTIGLKDVPSRVELPEGQLEARLEVLAPLRFMATTPRGQLPLSVAIDTDFYGGRIRLAAGAAPAWRDVRDGTMLMSLEPMLGIAVKQPMAIACNRLGLSDGASRKETPAPALPDGKWIGLGWDSVPFYRAPEETDPLDIQYCGAFVVKEARPGWLHLVAIWDDGSKLDGWTPDRQTSVRYEAFNGWSGGQWGGVSGGRTDGPTLMRVTLHTGVAVAAFAAGPVWATVTRDIQVDAVAPVNSDEWLQIVSVPGFPWPPGSFAHDHVWVRAREALSAASLPLEPG